MSETMTVTMTETKLTERQQIYHKKNDPPI